MTITPAILVTSPFVDSQKTKNYVAIKHVIGALLGLAINLIVSKPVSNAINNWAKTGKIPYTPGTKQLAALQLIVGGIAVALTIPPTAYLVNKLLPKVMKHIYPQDPVISKAPVSSNKNDGRAWNA